MVLLLLLAGGLIAILAVWYWKDRRYLAQPTARVVRAGLRQELEAEQAEILERKKKFEEALEKARGPVPP